MSNDELQVAVEDELTWEPRAGRDNTIAVSVPLPPRGPRPASSADHLDEEVRSFTRRAGPVLEEADALAREWESLLRKTYW
jgi:hypothetical protein